MHTNACCRVCLHARMAEDMPVNHGDRSRLERCAITIQFQVLLRAGRPGGTREPCAIRWNVTFGTGAWRPLSGSPNGQSHANFPHTISRKGGADAPIKQHCEADSALPGPILVVLHSLLLSASRITSASTSAYRPCCRRGLRFRSGVGGTQPWKPGDTLAGP